MATVHKNCQGSVKTVNVTKKKGTPHSSSSAKGYGVSVLGPFPLVGLYGVQSLSGHTGTQSCLPSVCYVGRGEAGRGGSASRGEV